MDKNLDMLITRQVPLDRALWFIQAVGQNDISQLSKSKNLQTHPILSYSADFTSALVENLKRQVSEALLPLTQTTGSGRLLPGMSLKGRPRNVLGEENNKDRWMAKWNYTLQLLNVCLEESMLDKQRLCSLLLQNLQMNPTRVTILWWTSIILQTIFDDILDTAWMSKTLIIAVYDWLESFRNGKEDAEDPLRHTCEEVGQGILRQIWLTDAEMFLIPELWAEQGARLRLKIYLAVSVAESGDKDRQAWDDLENRVDRLLCRKASSDEPLTALLNSEVTSNSFTPPVHNYGKVEEARLVSMLDEWEGEESIPSLTQRLFSDVDTKSNNGTHTQIDNRAACSSICKLLLMWATTTTRKREHRPYLVSSILRCRAGLSPHKTHLNPSSFDPADTDSEAACDPDRLLELQTGIMDWMDRQEAYFSTPLSDGAIEWTTRDAVLQMCQILLEQNVIDLSALLQKVIARGVLQAGNSNQGIIYSSLLRGYGDHGSRLALKWQMARISTLSGADVNDGAVSTGEESVKQQIETILAGMSTEASAGGDVVGRPSMELLVQRFFDLPAMERVSIKESWLVPALARALRRNKR